MIMVSQICCQICCGFWIIYDCTFFIMAGHDLYNEYISNNRSNNNIEIEHIYPDYITRSNINVSELFNNH
jgi:hypothetical protein